MPAAFPSMRSVASFTLSTISLALLCNSPLSLAGTPDSCPVSSSTQLSCHNTTKVANTCCFNAPGGQLLQTQFWDTSPSTGPTNSWTIHGLWPDNCDGSFQSNCDSSRVYTNIGGIISAAGQTDLLNYMNTYWKDIDGDDESFWEHEWSKHGTCISSLDPSCYTDYSSKQEVVDFFSKVVELFKTLTSYEFLSDAGITPSSTKTYTSADILAALKAPRGVSVNIQCSGSNLDEIWYFYNTQGSVQTGTFVPANPVGSNSDCPSTGIKYLPKSGGGTAPSPTTTKPGSPAPTGSFSGKGFLNVVTSSGSTDGCLISDGNWFIGGTCATYTAAASGSGFTLTSSKGACAISGGSFSCASGNSATVFTASAGKMLSGGSSDFYAASVPSGSVQSTVTTTEQSQHISIEWEST